MTYIFLSYAKADRDTALILRKMLEDKGFRVWMDMNTLELGEEHWPAIESNILASAALLLLVSDAAQKSAWLKRELDFAESIQKPIFPILVEGKGWSRLQVEALTLGFGLNMAFPESYLAELKALMSGTDNSLPAPIILKSVNKAEKKKVFQRRWAFGLLLTVLICFILIPVMKNDSRQEQVRNFAMTNEASRYISITSTAISREATRVRLEANISLTETAHSVETSQIINAVGTERSNERLAATATEAAANTATNAAATQSYEYRNELTAVSGNGTLPCTAIARHEEGITLFDLYVRPSLDSTFSSLRRENGEIFILTVSEWLVNEDGTWYRVGTSYSENRGYVLADELELDSACPR